MLKYALHKNASGSAKENEMSGGGDNQGGLSLGRVRCEGLGGHKGDFNKQGTSNYIAAQTSVQTYSCSQLMGTFDPIIWLNNRKGLNFLPAFSDSKASYLSSCL